MKTRPRLNFREWGEKFMDNPDGTPFRFRPWQRKPAEMLFDPSLQSVALRCFSGSGKTYLMGSAFLFAIQQLREQCAFMLPDVTASEDWGKNEFVPLLNHCNLVADIGHPKGGDLRREKIFKNGATLHFIGSNSAARLRRLQVGVMYADEIDAIKSEESDEGDKLKAFYMRGRGRKRNFKWMSSYPSLEGVSKIDAALEASQLFRWHVGCLGCGEKWEMDIDRDLVVTGDPEDAALRCPKCLRLFDDAERLEMAENGEWVTEDDDCGRVGFHLNALAHTGDFDRDTYSSWLHFLAEELRGIDDAENPEKAKRVFCNTLKAESYRPPVKDKPDPTAVWERCEGYDPDVLLPEGVLVIVAGADVQGDRIECEFVGYGMNRETWGLGYHVLNGDPHQTLVWGKLKELLEKRFQHPSGKQLRAACVAVDSGYCQDEVVKFCRQEKHFFAVKGAKAYDAPIVARDKLARLLSAHQPKVGTQEAKSVLRARLGMEPEDDGSFPQGYCHFPRRGDYNEGYFKMLFAEDSEMKTLLNGEVVEVFTCPEGVRNEAFDIRVYAHWAYLAPRFSLASIKAQMSGGKAVKKKARRRRNYAIKP